MHQLVEELLELATEEVGDSLQAGIDFVLLHHVVNLLIDISHGDCLPRGRFVNGNDCLFRLESS